MIDPTTFITPYIEGIKIAAIIIVGISIVGVTHHIDSRYYNKKLEETVARDQKTLNEIKQAYNDTIAKNNEDSKNKTASLQASLDKQTENYRKNLEDANIKIKAFKDSATINSDGSGGLWIKTAIKPQPSSSIGLHPSSDSTVASRTSNQTYAKLDESTSRSLIDIAADGDEAINQLNEVIDAYNRIQQKGCSPDKDQK